MVQGMVACMGAATAQPPLPLQGMALWREGVVVSVKGQVESLVFWVLGERG